MPVFALQFKAETLEGVDSIEIQGGRICLNLSKDGEEKNGVYIDQADVLEIADSKGTCNLLIKLSGMKKAASLTIVDTFPYKADDAGTWKTVARVEARGVDVTGWEARDDFILLSEGGKKFEGVDFGEGDVAEYDDENDQSVSILEISTRVEVDKSKK